MESWTYSLEYMDQATGAWDLGSTQSLLRALEGHSPVLSTPEMVLAERAVARLSLRGPEGNPWKYRENITGLRKLVGMALQESSLDTRLSFIRGVAIPGGVPLTSEDPEEVRLHSIDITELWLESEIQEI